MHSTALAEDRARSSPVSRFTLEAILLVVGLAILWFILCRQLSYEWAANEQYSYGWFIPFFAAFLFWLRWEERPGKGGRQKAEGGIVGALIAVVALAALFPVRLFEVANPDWRPLSWVHALIVVSLTLLAIWLWGGKSAVRHFAFPVCFILVAVPWITPIEAPLVQGLMRLVASVATETLTLFGIPAQLEGSLIRVNNGVVGVSEACSGVRSLQTSLMIGLLFGELKRLTIARRCALVGAALAIALFANFARAFFLVWIAATENLAAVERWHDIAGYAIVGAVFLGTVAIAAWLARGQRSEGRSQRSEVGDPRSEARPGFPSTLNPQLLAFFVLYLLFVEGGVETWYRWHERGLVASAGWTIRWPKTMAGYHEIKIDDEVRSTLRFDAGHEAAWRSPLNDVSGAQSASTYLFFFRWNPGGETVLRARAHRPDICLPSAGWKQISDRGVESISVRDGVKLPVRRVTFVHSRGSAIAHTFFVLQEDRLNPREPRPDLSLPNGEQLDWSFSGRWNVVRNGVRNLGQQTVEIIIVTSPQVNDLAAEQQFTTLMREIVVPTAANKRS